MTYTYYQKVVKTNDVEKAFSSYLGLNTGDIVLHGNTVRNIHYVGERGAIVLKAVSYTYDTTYTTISGISKTVNTFQKFSVGDKVLYKNNIRTVEYLDDNGRMVLKAVAYTYDRDFTTASQVSKAY